MEGKGEGAGDGIGAGGVGPGKEGGAGAAEAVALCAVQSDWLKKDRLSWSWSRWDRRKVQSSEARVERSLEEAFMVLG